MSQSEGYEKSVQEYAASQPELVKEAITRCKKKGFAKTHYNVLVEIKKIEQQNRNEPNLKDTVVQKLNDFREWIKNNSSISDIEKLERLNQLRKENALSEDEFQKLKHDILNKNKSKEDISKNTNSSKPTITNYDYAAEQFETNMRTAFKIINMLYFEFKDEDEYCTPHSLDHKNIF